MYTYSSPLCRYGLFNMFPPLSFTSSSHIHTPYILSNLAVSSFARLLAHLRETHLSIHPSCQTSLLLPIQRSCKFPSGCINTDTDTQKVVESPPRFAYSLSPWFGCTSSTLPRRKGFRWWFNDEWSLYSRPRKRGRRLVAFVGIC
jgi:hypothetical protein